MWILDTYFPTFKETIVNIITSIIKELLDVFYEIYIPKIEILYCSDNSSYSEGDTVGGNHGGNSESENDDSQDNHEDGPSAYSNDGNLAESSQDLIRRQYDSNDPQTWNTEHMNDYSCEHYGQMTEIPTGHTGSVRCERDDGPGGTGWTGGAHDTVETGGWTCSSCQLDICNVCAEDEVSRTGHIDGKASYSVEDGYAYESNPTPQDDASDQATQEETQDDEGYDDS